jgi:hypothetical protein
MEKGKPKLKRWRVRGPFNLRGVSAFATKAWYYRERNGLSVYVQTMTGNVCSIILPLAQLKNYIRSIEAFNRRAK